MHLVVFIGFLLVVRSLCMAAASNDSDNEWNNWIQSLYTNRDLPYNLVWDRKPVAYERVDFSDPDDLQYLNELWHTHFATLRCSNSNGVIAVNFPGEVCAV